MTSGNRKQREFPLCARRVVGEIEPTMSQELVAAYLKGPVVVALYVDFADVVRQPLNVAISGLITCRENVPLGAGSLGAIPPHIE